MNRGLAYFFDLYTYFRFLEYLDETGFNHRYLFGELFVWKDVPRLNPSVKLFDIVENKLISNDIEIFAIVEKLSDVFRSFYCHDTRVRQVVTKAPNFFREQ